MEGAGPDGTQRYWYRCTRCKHSLLITLNIESSKKSAVTVFSKEQCTTYSKDRLFTIGEHIYHTDLDDMGRVVRKDKTSNGTHSILVAFEKSGERRLLESVTSEMMEEVPEEPQPPGQE
jgi:hypothetical protein